MNVRDLANRITRRVNPNTTGNILIATPPVVDDEGIAVTHYDKLPCIVQVQPLDAGDIKTLEFMNIQGVEQSIFLNGNYEALDRLNQKGGDLIEFNGRVWKVLVVFSRWPQAGWCKLGVVGQLDKVSSGE